MSGGMTVSLLTADSWDYIMQCYPHHSIFLCVMYVAFVSWNHKVCKCNSEGFMMDSHNLDFRVILCYLVSLGSTGTGHHNGVPVLIMTAPPLPQSTGQPGVHGCCQWGEGWVSILRGMGSLDGSLTMVLITVLTACCTCTHMYMTGSVSLDVIAPCTCRGTVNSTTDEEGVVFADVGEC